MFFFRNTKLFFTIKKLKLDFKNGKINRIENKFNKKINILIIKFIKQVFICLF